jgi:uncharacterized linocin/CFP29 family protein
MNNLRYVGTVDEQLTTEQGLIIRERAVESARRKLKGRQLFGQSVRKIDSGAQSYAYDTLTHMSAAALDFTWPGRHNLDAINLARTTVAIPNLHKEFEINKLDLAASKLSGTPLNTSTSDSAAYKVAYLEDSLLINGFSFDGTNYDINGLFKAAGNTDGTSLDWGTKANIETSINNGIGLLLDDGIDGPWNLTINPTQRGQLNATFANTAVTYKQWVLEQLEGGSIITSAAMAESDGMLTPVNPEGMFEYVVAEDLTAQSEVTSLKEGNNLFGRVYVRGLPVVYDANAICTLTVI